MPSKRPLRHLTPGAVAGTTRTSRTSDAEWIVGRNEEDVDTDGVSDLENGTESEVRRMEQSLKKSMATDVSQVIVHLPANAALLDVSCISLR